MTLRRLTLSALMFAVGVAGTFVWFSFDRKIPPKSLPPSLLQREGIVPLLGKEEIAKAAGTVFLTLDFGDGSTQHFSDIPLVTGATAFSILKDAGVSVIYDPSTGAGVFVRQIGEKKNGDGGRYWQYWVHPVRSRPAEGTATAASGRPASNGVNADFGMVAADKYILQPGDRVKWKFAEEQRQ